LFLLLILIRREDRSQTTVASHDLHDKATLMTKRRGHNSVHGLDNTMQSRVGANRHVGAAKVVVDGADQADYIEEHVFLLLGGRYLILNKAHK
jgi:hypothetical protein